MNKISFGSGNANTLQGQQGSHFATSEALSNTNTAITKITDGTTQVGNAAKLGGKSAESYYNLNQPTQAIPSGADLNDYTTGGVYRSWNDNDAVTNVPYGKLGWFELIVEVLHPTHLIQTVKSMNSGTWQRIMIGGTWQGWTRLDKQTNALTPDNFPSNLSSDNKKYVYVSPSGSDDNAGTDANAPMKTLLGAINKYKGAYSLNIKLMDGEYTLPNEQIVVSGYTDLYIAPYNGNKTTVFIKVPKEIRFLGGTVNITNCTFSYTGTSAHGNSILIFNRCVAEISSIIINGSSQLAHGLGVYNGAIVTARGITINDSNYAIENHGGVIFCDIIDGTGNKVGYRITQNGGYTQYTNSTLEATSLESRQSGNIVTVGASNLYTTSKQRFMSLETAVPTSITNGYIVAVYE